jgi:hypothetical protein
MLGEPTLCPAGIFAKIKALRPCSLFARVSRSHKSNGARSTFVFPSPVAFPENIKSLANETFCQAPLLLLIRLNSCSLKVRKSIASEKWIVKRRTFSPAGNFHRSGKNSREAFLPKLWELSKGFCRFHRKNDKIALKSRKALPDAERTGPEFLYDKYIVSL